MLMYQNGNWIGEICFAAASWHGKPRAFHTEKNCLLNNNSRTEQCIDSEFWEYILCLLA